MQESETPEEGDKSDTAAREYMTEAIDKRETLDQCYSATDHCNGRGTCAMNTRHPSQYICICDPGSSNGVDGNCYEMTKREFAMLDLSLRDSEIECVEDTNDCNGVGTCVQDRFGWRCSCDDWSAYTIGPNGSCVPRSKRSNISRSTSELLKRILALMEENEEN
ncbi:fibropellin-2-like [Diadema antillarum]|uniref:fibropellin-2-like n=1 Tax=Diadema antillarum TaxID=105358 RepID=UPI003A83AB80